jgi:WD40 repeat protein
VLAVGCNPFGNEKSPLWGNSRPGEVVLFDARTRKEIRRLTGHTGKVLSLAFSPDGTMLAVGGGKGGKFPGEVRLWDWKEGLMVADLHGARQQVHSLAFSPKGHFLAAAGGNTQVPDGMAQWDLALERRRVTLKGHTGRVNCAALSSDGKTLATGSFDKTIRLWDTSKWTLKAVLKGHEGLVRCVAISPDGKTLASTSDDRTVRLWDVETGKEKGVLTRHTIAAMSVAYSRDGTLLATSSSREANATGGEIRVFETATGKERLGGQWSKRGALSVAFSPDGRWLAAGGPGSPALTVYDVKSGKLAKTVQIASVRHLAFSPDGSTLATAHGQGGRRGDGSILLWDTTTWEEKGHLQGNQGLCLSVAFSHEGRTLTSGSADGSARVWDLPTPPRAMAPRR